MQYINIGVTGNILSIVMEVLYLFLLSPKVSSKFYAVYHINIGVIGNIVIVPAGRAENIGDGGSGCKYLFIQNKIRNITIQYNKESSIVGGVICITSIK